MYIYIYMYTYLYLSTCIYIYVYILLVCIQYFVRAGSAEAHGSSNIDMAAGCLISLVDASATSCCLIRPRELEIPRAFNLFLQGKHAGILGENARLSLLLSLCSGARPLRVGTVFFADRANLRPPVSVLQLFSSPDIEKGLAGSWASLPLGKRYMFTMTYRCCR